MKKLSLLSIILVSILACNTPEQTKSPEPSKTPQSSVSPTPIPEAKFIFDSKKEYNASIDTSLGIMKFKLFTDKTPKAVENFTTHSFNGYYNNLTFHRVISGFMIQGGDPSGNGTGGESIFGKSFEDEFSSDLTFNKKGLLAMANSGPNTNGSQFFITLAPVTHLNNKHTIFGEIIEGIETLESIGDTPIGANDRPLNTVFIKKISIE